MLQLLVFIVSGWNPGFILFCCRDALSDLAIHFLDKLKVMVVKDIEREDIEFVTKVRSEVCTITTLNNSVEHGVIIVVQN
jgi:chaperonin GroEL (HSP60 family)